MRRGALRLWAVPVLPATLTPGIWAAVPVPAVTTFSIIRVSCAATSGVTACEICSGLVRSMTSQVGAADGLTR